MEHHCAEYFFITNVKKKVCKVELRQCIRNYILVSMVEKKVCIVELRQCIRNYILVSVVDTIKQSISLSQISE